MTDLIASYEAKILSMKETFEEVNVKLFELEKQLKIKDSDNEWMVIWLDR